MLQKKTGNDLSVRTMLKHRTQVTYLEIQVGIWYMIYYVLHKKIITFIHYF